MHVSFTRYSGCYLSLHTGPHIVPPAITRATIIYNLRPEHVPEGAQRVDLGSERRKIIVVWDALTIWSGVFRSVDLPLADFMFMSTWACRLALRLRRKDITCTQPRHLLLDQYSLRLPRRLSTTCIEAALVVTGARLFGQAVSARLQPTPPSSTGYRRPTADMTTFAHCC